MEDGESSRSVPFTRSYTVPLNRDRCFFCQEDTGENAFNVCTENAGESLKAAVEKSNDSVFNTRLNACISPTDALAIDAKYHKSCWRKHVFYILRDRGCTNKQSHIPKLQNACLIELINLIELQTKNQEYLSMEDIEATYRNMLGDNGVENHIPNLTRQWLKDKILSELPSVKSVLQTNRRKPSLLYSPAACEEEMVNIAISSDNSDIDNMKTIFNAAKLIRKSIVDFQKENGAHMQVCSDTDDVPGELYSMVRWILVGPAVQLASNRIKK